jgi:hypothetical protein
MVPGPAEKAQIERTAQLKLYRIWKGQIRQGLLDGEFAPEIVQLLRLLRRLPEPDVLMRFVEGATWLRNGSQVMRYAALDYIDHSLMRWRIRQGLPPFDDGLPTEPDTPFVTIRKMLAREEVMENASRAKAAASRFDLDDGEAEGWDAGTRHEEKTRSAKISTRAKNQSDLKGQSK